MKPELKKHEQQWINCTSSLFLNTDFQAKKNFVKGAMYSTLKPGDRVRVRNLSEREKPGALYNNTLII